MDFMDGFSLMFALLLATIGGVGLIVRKRASHDAPFMLAVARTFTVSSVALLGISSDEVLHRADALHRGHGRLLLLRVGASPTE